jgi:hypothetical protein
MLNVILQITRLCGIKLFTLLPPGASRVIHAGARRGSQELVLINNSSFVEASDATFDVPTRAANGL